MFGFMKKKKAPAEEEKITTSFAYDEERVLYFNNFENSAQDWRPRGSSVRFSPEQAERDGYDIILERTAEEKHSGTHCLKVSGRKFGWNGAMVDLTRHLRDNVFFYEAAVWVKIPSDAPSCRVCLSLEANTVFAGVPFQKFHYWHDFKPEHGILSKYLLPVGAGEPGNWDTQYQPGCYTEDGWVLLRGRAEIHKTHFDSIFAYIETDADRCNYPIYIDDFMLLMAESQIRDPNMPAYSWSNFAEGIY